MDGKVAAALLDSLLERAKRDQTLGSVSALEQEALRLAVQALGDPSAKAAPVVQPPAHQPTAPVPAILPAAPPPINTETSTSRPKVKLVLDSIERKPEPVPDVLMCLDFGTAMSKAFAFTKRVPSPRPDDFNPHLELALGEAAGRQGHAIPSSVYIADDGKAWFGFEAMDISQGLENSRRTRIDSIKDWISLQHEGSLDDSSKLLSKALNPSDVRLTQGDLLRAYLAYLTDMAERALQVHVPGARYVKRRYARPCWPNSKLRWGRDLMRQMLAEAQILADTFNGRWSEGIGVGELKEAIEQVKKLAQRPDYLIGDGVPESVAVAAGAIADSENLRDAYMVVDVGAGTTDFGLFIAGRRSDDDEFHVFQNSSSIHGLTQAGNKIDGLLRGFIAQKESIDTSDNAGMVILADLTRRIRSLKETLFKTGELEYTLADNTIGKVQLSDFLADEKVVRFGHAVEAGFVNALEQVHDSWLTWLATDPVRLKVILTGGSSPLPMMKVLQSGTIEIKGHTIMREAVNPAPEWIDDMPEELLSVYPQLAVAIGGSAEAMPETMDGPIRFMGGTRAPTYVAGGTHRDA